MAPETSPEFYRRFGKTAKGDPRFQCRLCLKTFSIEKPARRHLRSDNNRIIFQMLCNDVSRSKISKIADISYRDLYGKIGFFYDQIQSFVAQRGFLEGRFSRSRLKVRDGQPDARGFVAQIGLRVSFPFPRRTQPTGSVIGRPIAV